MNGWDGYVLEEGQKEIALTATGLSPGASVEPLIETLRDAGYEVQEA